MQQGLGLLDRHRRCRVKPTAPARCSSSKDPASGVSCELRSHAASGLTCVVLLLAGAGALAGGVIGLGLTAAAGVLGLGFEAGGVVGLGLTAAAGVLGFCQPSGESTSVVALVHPPMGLKKPVFERRLCSGFLLPWLASERPG